MSSTPPLNPLQDAFRSADQDQNEHLSPQEALAAALHWNDEDDDGSMSLTEASTANAQTAQFALQAGQAQEDGDMTSWQFDDGRRLDINPQTDLNSDLARSFWHTLLSGGSITESELRHLESFDGSRDLFPDDDWNTWIASTRIVEAPPTHSFAAEEPPVPGADNYIYKGSDEREHVVILEFGDSDATRAGEMSPDGEPYAVTVAHGSLIKRHYLTEAQARHMVFDMGGGDDVVDNRTPFPVTVFGGTGDDTLIGSSQADALIGQDGNDDILGAAGEDTLEGGAGEDWLQGGSQSDTLAGGEGQDTLWGGATDDADLLQDTPDDNKLLTGYLADSGLYDQPVSHAKGIDGIDLLSGTESADSAGTPATRYVLRARTELGALDITVTAHEGTQFDTPEKLIDTFSMLTPPLLLAASKLEQGVALTNSRDAMQGYRGLFTPPAVQVAVLATNELTQQEVVTFMAHELGHYISYLGDHQGPWKDNRGKAWQDAMRADGKPASEYGATSQIENFAEFGALYFKATDNQDEIVALKAASPECFRVFEAYLQFMLKYAQTAHE